MLEDKAIFKRKPQRFLTQLLLMTCLLLGTSVADFIGSVSMSDSVVEATDVTYTFNLRFERNIPSDGKLVIRFPDNFVNEFAVTGCTAISGFSVAAGSSLSCSYVPSVRLLSIDNAFPTTFTEIQFEVKGVTNPKYSQSTDVFAIDSYEKSGGEFITLESSSPSIFVTPTAGAISEEKLDLSDPTVGKYSDMTVTMKASHEIPSTGTIEIDFPKWNSFSPFQLESYVATSTSPGSVPCDAITNIPVTTGIQLDCVFSHGTTLDKLTVSFAGYLSSNIASDTLFSFKIKGVRGPPSTNAMTGFNFRTTSQTGDLIDQSVSGSVALYAVFPAQGTAANMIVTSDDPSINAPSTLTMRIQTINPLQPESNIIVTIPTQFGVNAITSVTTLGNSLEPTPTWSFDAATRKLTVQKINKVYLTNREYLYIVLAKVTNPGQTEPTDSFIYEIYDPLNNVIEGVSQGITFESLAGGFGFISVGAADTLINKRDVEYTFSMRPQDVFTSAAIIKITCPTQISIYLGSAVQRGSPDIVFPSKATTEIKFNRIIYIRDAFPNGLQDLQTFEITLNGFINPKTTQKTDSFEVSIFYEEGVNEVSHYVGNGLTIEATPSTALTQAASMGSDKLGTGVVQSQFIISGTMERYNPVEKQAYLRVKIPGAFLISNYDRVASTCTRLTGFSDEISCSFEKVEDAQWGNYMLVKGGFDSEDFDGSEFSFQIAEIKNPFTTQKTDSFEMEIYDRFGGLMYTANNNVRLQANSSPFAFVHVESLNPRNGVNAIYQVTITLGVDTSQGAYLEFNPPDDISFEDQQGSICRGTQNLAESLSCQVVSDTVRKISIPSDDLFQKTSHQNGTTIQFEIGYMRNPMSLKTSGYFYLATYQVQGMNKYYINESKKDARIRNSESGPITVEAVQSTNLELGEDTQFRVLLETTSAIPSNGRLIVTLPSNILIQQGVQMTINDQPVNPQINLSAKQFIVDGLPVDGQTNFDLRFRNGIINPTNGPYSYEYLQIEFLDQYGYSIDKVIKNTAYLTTQCTNDCETCSGSLSKCTSCSYNSGIESSFFLKADELKCVQDCGPGFFEDTGYVCSPCDSKCLECKVSATSCTLCNPVAQPGQPLAPYADPRTLRCYSECPTGTYLDESTTLCTPCELPCYTCSDKDTCTSCDRTDMSNQAVFFFEREQKCFEECPDISVPTPSKQCDACVTPCETCQYLPSNCVTCIEGHYLHKNNECITSCPFLYFENDEQRKCSYFGELSLPVPFSIIAFVCTVGVGISSFVKGADKNGKEQEGTAFFMTMLAIVDMELRVCWAILAYVVYQKEFYITFGFICGILGMSLFINIFLWRRYFYSKYKYEETDPLFSAYCAKYSGTANSCIFLSYLLSFQAIRLTYSRFLGKKKFMAGFTKRRRYFRLIGRLTVLECFLIYIPAIAVNIYSLTVITDAKTMQYWYNLDSLILMCYAVILIIVVLTQREKLMNYKSYFNFSELFTFGDDADQDEVPVDAWAATTFPTKPSARDAGSIASMQDDDPISMHSAMGHDEIVKPRLYQVEQRQQTPPNEKMFKGSAQNFNRQRTDSDISGNRVVSVIDYVEYRKLEDKRDRVMLKKTLYERKKGNDESQVVILNSELNKYQKEKDSLAQQLATIKKHLKTIQKDIVHTDKSRKKELYNVEQKKRREIINRQGREVPYQSHSGVTATSRSKSQLTKSQNNTQVSKSPRDIPNAGQAKRKRGQRQHQQSTKSPNQTNSSVPGSNVQNAEAVNSSMNIDNQAANIFNQNLNLTEPMTLPSGVHPQAQDAIALQLALEQQLSTEKAESLTKPGIKRSVHDSDTEKGAMPVFHRDNESMILSTERADNLYRPGEQLASEEVADRVVEANMEPDMQGSQHDQDAARDSFGPPQLSPSPDGQKQDKDDEVWE